MTTFALSAQQYNDAKQVDAAAPELRSSLNRARLALMNLGQIDLNGYKPSLKLIRFGTPKSALEGNIDTMFAWLAHGLRIANGIGDRDFQQTILNAVKNYEGQELYLAYHLIQLNTLSMPGHTLSASLQNWLLEVIQQTVFTAEAAVDLLRLSKIVHRFGLDVAYNLTFDASRKPPVFFSHDYIQDILSALWARSAAVDLHVTSGDKLELDGVYAMRQMLQRYLRHCGIGVHRFLADTQNEWGGWIYCYLNHAGQIHELWASGTLSPFPHLVHFLRMILLRELPASFDWDEEGLTKTFVAEPDAHPDHFHFRLITNVEGSNTRQVLIDTVENRYEFVAAFYAGLKDAKHLKPYWGLPNTKIAAVKRMLERHPGRLR